MSERDPRFDTMELKELHKMIDSVDQEQSSQFDLDTIIAEVNSKEPPKKAEPEKKPDPDKPVQTVPRWTEVKPDPEDEDKPVSEGKAAPETEKPVHKSLWQQFKEEMTGQKRQEPAKEEAQPPKPKFVFMEAKLGEERREELKAQSVKTQGSSVEAASRDLAGKPERQAPAGQKKKPQFVFMEDKLGREEAVQTAQAENLQPEEMPPEKQEEKGDPSPKEHKYRFHIVEAQLGQENASPSSSLERQDTDIPDLSATWTPERLAVLKERKEELRRRRAMEAAGQQEPAKKQEESQKAKRNQKPDNQEAEEDGIEHIQPLAPEPDVRIFHPRKKRQPQTEPLREEVPEKPEAEEKAQKPEKKTGKRRRWLFIRSNRRTEDEQPVQPEQNAAQADAGTQGRNEIGDISKLDREEEESRAKDPRRATKTCSRRAKFLRMRSRIVLLLLLGAAYLTMGNVFSLPVPQKIAYAVNPSLYLFVLVILEIFSMLIAIDVVGAGLYNLFTKTPDLLTAVSAALIGSLAHSICMILIPSMASTVPFTAVHMAILYTAMRGEEHRASGKQAIYKVASLSKNPIGIYCHNPEKKARMMILKFRTQDMEDFLKDIEKPDSYEKLSRLYGPIVIVVSLVLALVAAFAGGDKSRFLWAYSAILSMALSFGLISAFCLPYKYVSRKMMREGVAIAGVRVAGLLSRSRQVALTDGDLFPAGTVEIEGLRVFGRYTAERVLSYATAVIGGSGSSTYKVFAETLRERYGTPVRAANVLQYESGGLSADIRGDSVLVGGAPFVMRMGIPIQEGRNIQNSVFVVINNEVAGIFAMKYNPCAQSYAGIHTLLRNRKTPVLATRDFNINPILTEKCFDMKHGVLEYPELSRRSMLSDRGYVEKDTLCAILSRDDLAPYSDCIQAAGKLTWAVTANVCLGLLSSILGIVIMFFLTFTGSFLSATPLNVLLYLILWDIPVIFISQNTKKSY